MIKKMKSEELNDEKESIRDYSFFLQAVFY